MWYGLSFSDQIIIQSWAIALGMHKSSEKKGNLSEEEETRNLLYIKDLNPCFVRSQKSFSQTFIVTPF